MSIKNVISRRRRITVQPWEEALVLRRGAILRVEPAGSHRRARSEVWHIVDVRPRWLVLAPQEVLTSDGLQVKVTPAVRWSVTDVTRFVTSVADPEVELYARAQLALRSIVASRTLDGVLALRAATTEPSTESLSIEAAAIGVEALEFQLRDVTLPGELRRALAETALAREEGRAKLERARGESAALRSLANTAQLLAAHPALLELRAIEAASATGRIVVRLRDDTSAPD